MNENLKKKKLVKIVRVVKTRLSKRPELRINLFLEIIHHKNFFCKLLLQKTFYKLVLWIIFFKCCKLSSDIFQCSLWIVYIKFGNLSFQLSFFRILFFVVTRMLRYNCKILFNILVELLNKRLDQIAHFLTD